MLNYCHDRDFIGWSDKTIAVELPSKSTLTQLFLTHSTQTLIDVGYTFCNPKDQFVKRMGREIAAFRVKQSVATLKSIEIRGTKHIYHFDIRSDGAVVELGVSTVAESEHVCLIYGSVRRCVTL